MVLLTVSTQKPLKCAEQSDAFLHLLQEMAAAPRVHRPTRKDDHQQHQGVPWTCPKVSWKEGGSSSFPLRMQDKYRNLS